MRKRLLLGGGASLVLAALALVFTMNAVATRKLPAPPTVTGCYTPDVVPPGSSAGDTTGSLTGFSGKMRFEVSPVDSGKDDGSARTKTHGSITIEATMDNTGGALGGSFIASWNVGGKKGKFVASCIQEGQTDTDTPPDTTDDWEAEYEGTVSGLQWSKGAQPGVATIAAHNSAKGMVVSVSFEQGTTCFENAGELTATNANDPKWIQAAAGTLAADDIVAGLWNIPAPFDNTASNPCKGVFG